MKLYLATSNRHKVEEVALALARYGVEVVAVRAEKLEIQSRSLEEIALTAAKNLREMDAPVAVEDAGLFIHALKGFPGPYSHYVYDTIGIPGVLKLLEGVEDRRAVFVSVIAVKTPDGRVEAFRGEVEGNITREPRGTRGFGFDPIFQPLGADKTFAEMSVNEKNEYSHRARAARALAEWLMKNFQATSRIE
ncbi:XTP/dITP diphosphatase [Infirmifilum lucidum]|uniref:dITP/XTP pyrophosphatase n=1 Tax=Infirmifilum lucidum TaxID=2776706 RepID=A0A7L9FKJ3_9CREN|nr:XTP/dITP diphosphatase [Infirmifilum lucidum]QOJ79464.1 XTP/dITP diphosphatase [Infirmifilum lucidum]